MFVRRKSPGRMYKTDKSMGMDGKEFVAYVSKLYTKHKKEYPNVNRPKTIKAAVAFVRKMGGEVYYKEPGWQYSRY